MSAISDLAERLTTINLAKLPDEVIEAARQRLFDNLASFVAGSATAEAALLRKVLDTPLLSLADGIRYACAATRCTEVDDIHSGSCTTVGSIVVPVALLQGAANSFADGDVLCGLVAGYEAMTRLGCAVDGAHRIYEGIWATYLAAPLTAAAVSARLMRVDAGQMAHALAIAAARSTGMTPRVSGQRSPRWYLAGAAAAEGYAAARAAAVGLEGDQNILETGFGRAAGVDFDAVEFGRDLDGWRILDIDTKPFQTSRQGLAATEAFLQLSESRTASDIKVVEAWTPEQVQPLVNNPNSPLGLQHQLARAAIDREALWDVAGKRPIDAETLAATKAKVRVAADAKLTSLYPSQWGGRVRLTWNDGSSDEIEVLDPHGSAARPFGWDQLVDKHQRIGRTHGREDLGWIEQACNICRKFGEELDGKHSPALIKALPGSENFERIAG